MTSCPAGPTTSADPGSPAAPRRTTASPRPATGSPPRRSPAAVRAPRGHPAAGGGRCRPAARWRGSRQPPPHPGRWTTRVPAPFSRHAVLPFHGEYGSPAVTRGASASTACTQAANTACGVAAAAGISASAWRAMKPVSNSAAANAGWVEIARRKPTLLRMPTISQASSAAVSRRSAAGRSRSHTITWRSSGRSSGRSRPRCAPPCPPARAGPPPACRNAAACRWTAGSRAPDPRHTAAPRSRARDRQLRLPQRQGSPAATRSCHSTRSSPVIISVTGCSTCRRVFISMK